MQPTRSFLLFSAASLATFLSSALSPGRSAAEENPKIEVRVLGELKAGDSFDRLAEKRYAARDELRTPDGKHVKKFAFDGKVDFAKEDLVPVAWMLFLEGELIPFQYEIADGTVKIGSPLFGGNRASVVCTVWIAVSPKRTPVVESPWPRLPGGLPGPR